MHEEGENVGWEHSHSSERVQLLKTVSARVERITKTGITFKHFEVIESD